MNQPQIKEFLDNPRGLLIAPAGYGKTYSIAQMVKTVVAEKPQLILTHTHAGIASLREKLQHQETSPNAYHLETICGFIQRYVLAFVPGVEIPQQEDKLYFDRLISLAADLFSKPSIKRIIHTSFSHLYIDEYQDCTKKQHSVIMLLSNILPTHLLGDPLQAIFNFGKNTIVDFKVDLRGFTYYDFLQTPWRWKNTGNILLGKKISEFRDCLLSNSKQVKLSTDNSANLNVIIHQIENRYVFFHQKVAPLIKKIKSSSVLIIYPSYIDDKNYLRGSIHDRVKTRLNFDTNREFVLLEAIDDEKYYKLAMQTDELLKQLPKSVKPYKKIYEFLKSLTLNTSDISKWITEDNVVAGRKHKKILTDELSSKVTNLLTLPSYISLHQILVFFTKTIKLKAKRPDILHSAIVTSQLAALNNTSMIDEMRAYKNRIRRIGRKIDGKCIGTTLLTKGLEFDTVILIEAEKITSPCDFYVAISRACKNLYIFSKTMTLNFK